MFSGGGAGGEWGLTRSPIFVQLRGTSFYRTSGDHLYKGAALIMKLIFGRFGGIVGFAGGVCRCRTLFQLVSIVAVRGCGEGVWQG